MYGGRWNHKNVPLIYTSETRALATTEFLVHVNLNLLPEDLSIATIQLPESVTFKKLEIEDLPGNWRSYPAPPELATMGTEWANSQVSLILKVPSVVVLHETNVLINTMHPDMAKVKIVGVEDYFFDPRLVK